VIRSIESVFGKTWFKVIESLIVLGIMYYIVSSTISLHLTRSPQETFYLTACIILPTLFITIYVESVFKSPWPRILLPYSLANSTLLASIMIYGTLPEYLFRWVIVGYALAIFTLFHALTRMFSLFLWERRSRFKAIIEGVLIDLFIFSVISVMLVAIMIYYRAILLVYGLLLIIGEILILVLVPRFIEKFIVPSLLSRGYAIYGFRHPREPEIERLYFALSSVTVLFILVVPAVMSYTSVSLTRRAFIPLALLGVYEAIIMAYYTITYIVSIHGAFIESLLGDRIVGIEHGRVIDIVEVSGNRVRHKWRDIAWFFNVSLSSYLKMKYLSALFMLFQGLEILSLRTCDRELYFGTLYDLINHGYRVLMNNSSAKKYVFKEAIDKTIETLKPENIYVIEGNWKPLEGTGYEEELKKALGSIVNLYCKLHEIPNLDMDEARAMIKSSIIKLVNLKKKVRGRALLVINDYINELDKLLEKDRVDISDLEKFLIKQPLTINMLRNYIVHGQLYKNALVHRNNRVEADRIFNKPEILYALYTLLITAVFDKHPELIKSIKER